MRRIAHISDLHFGHEDPEVAEGLLEELRRARPDLIVVSGDVTHHARRRQFELARAFLAQMPAKTLVVPGNHDVPRYDIIRRFELARPLRRYRQYISDDLQPFYADDELAVIGLNTARSLSFRTGRISTEQIRAVRSRFNALPASVFKVVVSHHQLVPAAGHATGELVGRARLALTALDLYGVDLVLAGRLHHGFAADVRTCELLSRSVIAANSGSSCSTHEREEPNSYNLIQVERGHVSLSARTWTGAGFSEALRSEFARLKDDWRRTAIELEPVALGAQPTT